MATGPEGLGSQSLEDFAGEAFGDFVGSSDTAPSTDDSSPAVAAGAPPAEHAERPSGDSPAGSEAQPAAVAPGAPPGEHANPSADPAAVDPDPLAGASPFTYTVNGETRPYDGIKVLPGLGGIIDADKLPDLMRRLGERDHLYETSQQQYKATQALERLTAWDVTRADGSKETLTGAAAMQARTVSHANALAELKTLKDALADPDQLSAILAFDETTNTVVLNPRGLEALATKAENLSMKLQQGIAARFASASQQQPAAAAEPDVSTLAPHVVAQFVTKTGAKGLTDKDTAKLAAMVPRFIRVATEDDRRQHPMLKVGEKIVDDSFSDEVLYLAELRAESARTTQANVAANTSNAARLAAAARGQRTTPTPAGNRTPATPTTNRATDAGDAWDLMEKLSNRALAAKG